MTTEQARACFDAMAATFRAHGMADRAASIELCREYFTNPDFKQWLEDYLFAQRRADFVEPSFSTRDME